MNNVWRWCTALLFVGCVFNCVVAVLKGNVSAASGWACAALMTFGYARRRWIEED